MGFLIQLPCLELMLSPNLGSCAPHRCVRYRGPLQIPLDIYLRCGDIDVVLITHLPAPLSLPSVSLCTGLSLASPCFYHCLEVLPILLTPALPLPRYYAKRHIPYLNSRPEKVPYPTGSWPYFYNQVRKNIYISRWLGVAGFK